MKKFTKLLSLVIALCMLLSISAFASDESTTASAEPGKVESAPVAYSSASALEPSEYEYLTNYTNRDTT